MNIKVMSFNLRYDKPDAGNHAWTIRKDAVAALFTHHAPDIIGTQEGKAHQLLDLHRLLPDYQSVGHDRTGTDTNEYCAIFYRPERLRCLATDDFFLSDTPNIPGSISPNWGNPLPRMATWAVFTIAGEEKTIMVVNTHLDYNSAKARELGVMLIRDRIYALLQINCIYALLQANHVRPLKPSESYLLITGDFNTAPGTVPREALLTPLPNGLQLYDVLSDVELKHQMSFHDFTGKAFDAVDTIYYDNRLRLRNVKLDAEQWQGIFPSDHFAVVAEFVFSI